jgi:alpha-galactosidase
MRQNRSRNIAPQRVLRARAIVAVLLAIAFSLSLPPPHALALDDGLADRPPLGWNCYHWFGCQPSEKIMRNAADAIVSNGLKAAGYLYVNMDDGWMAKSRDAQGNLVANPTRFPGGLKALTDYIHAKGLKAGIYLGCGRETYQTLPGSLGFEKKDADQIAAWGFDFLKYDYRTMGGDPPRDCKAENIKMSGALKATGRPIFFSMCEHGRSQPWTWAAPYAHEWRISTDIKDYWDGEHGGGWGFNKIVDRDAGLSAYAGPGHWNDPDMMIIGLHGRQNWMGPGLTDTEYRAHFSLWCLLASPLMLGFDPANMSTATKETVLNPEVLAVDQDPLGKQARRVSSAREKDVWVKPLQTGLWAVGLYNRSGAATEMTVPWNDLGLAPTQGVQVRDLWNKSDLGSFTDHFTRSVASHECLMLKISPPSPGSKQTPAGPRNVNDGAARQEGNAARADNQGRSGTAPDRSGSEKSPVNAGKD